MSWTPRQTEQQEAARAPQQAVGRQACAVELAKAKKKDNFAYRPVCFECKEVKAPKKDRQRFPKPASSLEQELKKHIAAAKDLQQQLQAALLAAQQQKWVAQEGYDVSGRPVQRPFSQCWPDLLENHDDELPGDDQRASKTPPCG
eukprot:5146206-Amphidinium_carterae.1